MLLRIAGGSAPNIGRALWMCLRLKLGENIIISLELGNFSIEGLRCSTNMKILESDNDNDYRHMLIKRAHHPHFGVT